MSAYRATYSPEDNKLRLYSTERLDAETYAKVKAEGFIYAPKQGLFVAPKWTPGREALLIELCGEVGDEDTSLEERAEQRAERFEDYAEKRGQEAEQARSAVAAIADNIPLGQPILVGHHSEKRARKDAERIENGMRRAVNLWETAKHWEYRANAAIRDAKYKMRPDVRARRIKGLEADQRRQQKERDAAAKLLKWWQQDGITREKALQVCNCFDHGPVTLPDGTNSWSAWDALERNTITLDALRAQRLERLPRWIAGHDVWLKHYANRIAYERAMLAADGGIASDKTGPEVGGAVRCWASPGGQGWSYIQKVNKVSVTVLSNWGNGGGNFTRTMPFDKLKAVMTRAQVDEARAAGTLIETADQIGFYLVGSPSTTPPKPNPEAQPEADAFKAMKDTLRAGVKVVAAPQLFPTPPELAKRLVKLADVQPGQRVLEPSAGTGNIIRAILDAFTGADCGRIVAVEVNFALAEGLQAQRNRTLYANEQNFDVRCSDFLSLNGDLGTFDRIVMNPPFERGADIEHIKHARHMLKPGGRLVAVCANGSRQRAAFESEAAEWIDLPPDTFKSEGTGVNTAIVVFDA